MPQNAAPTDATALTFAEVAARLRMSPDTLMRKLPTLFALGLYEMPRLGRRRLFSAHSVDAIINGQGSKVRGRRAVA